MSSNMGLLQQHKMLCLFVCVCVCVRACRTKCVCVCVCMRVGTCMLVEDIMYLFRCVKTRVKSTLQTMQLFRSIQSHVELLFHKLHLYPIMLLWGIWHHTTYSTVQHTQRALWALVKVVHNKGNRQPFGMHPGLVCYLWGVFTGHSSP